MRQSYTDRDGNRHLTCAETAGFVRSALKRTFPAVKFTVHSKTYSGGASITVKWVDGPTDEQVETVTKQYEGAAFDGMIDLKTYVERWLLPDGTTRIAHTVGTEGSHGGIPAVRLSPMPAGAVRVWFGADYVFTSRGFSPAVLRRIADEIAREVNVPTPEIVTYADGTAYLADFGPYFPERYAHLSDLVYRALRQTAA